MHRLTFKMAASLCRFSMTSTIISPCFRILLKGETASYACVRYAKKLAGGAKMSAQPVKKEPLPVETDVDKLVNFVCGANILKDSEMIPLKVDSEYPDWLWKLNCGPPPELSTLDPSDVTYWKRLRKQALRRKAELMKIKKF